MAATTPRRSTRTSFTHTPKFSERKKGLFQSGSEPPRESLTEHRRLPVVDSESDSEDYGLGIISALDSSSGEENDHGTPKTPERTYWHETRSQTRKLLRENHDLKSFIKSPFTLKKYQNRYCPEKCTGSLSTPVTPHLQHHPGTPSSTHSCTSGHTTSSTSSKARKSLASLIADTESCSSSLKDLTFDTDSGTDSKENTPTKSVRRSSRRQKLTPQFHSFKGILVEQRKNSPMSTEGVSPMKNAVVCLTRMDMSTFVSPSQMLKTPQTADAMDSPPKLSHRRSVLEIEESPESTCDSEKSHKRLRNDSLTEQGPNSKYPRLENAPKARLSLFNSDRLKEILSTKSFYGKSNPELSTTVTAKICNAVEVTTVRRRRPYQSTYNRRKRAPGQINMGVRHRIRKPKHKNKMVKYSKNGNTTLMNNSTISNLSADATMISQNSSQDLTLTDKADPFDKEKQTIEALLSQWEEEEVPASELTNKELPCFNSSIIEETSQIFQPVTAVLVNEVHIPKDEDTVLVELGTNHLKPNVGPVSQNQLGRTAQNQLGQTVQNQLGQTAQNQLDQTVQNQLGQTAQNQHGQTAQTQLGPMTSQNVTTNATSPSDVVMTDPKRHSDEHGSPMSGQFLPVEGGYILVEDRLQGQEIPDLDEIERELKMLDEQLLKMAESNNINAEAMLASTELNLPVNIVNDKTLKEEVKAESKHDNEKPKLFPIFSNPNPGVQSPHSKGEKSSKKSLLKTGNDQYVIDAGQKKFGATQCPECGTIYQIGDPQDEHDHMIHHTATDVLRFNGYKDECIVESSQSWRIIRSRTNDTTWRRVLTLLDRVVHPHLGYVGQIVADNVLSLTAYLYIEKKQILGCLIAETKTKAYKMIPGDPDCCSVEHYPVKCGISRIWTHKNHRRRGIARQLLDCARVSFLYGQALKIEDIAFSAPTTAEPPKRLDLFIARQLLDCARVSFLYGQALKIEDIAFSAPTTADNSV